MSPPPYSVSQDGLGFPTSCLHFHALMTGMYLHTLILSPTSFSLSYVYYFKYIMYYYGA